MARPVPAGSRARARASLAFLAFLLARPVGDDAVKLVANLAQRELPFPLASTSVQGLA